MRSLLIGLVMFSACLCASSGIDDLKTQDLKVQEAIKSKDFAPSEVFRLTSYLYNAQLEVYENAKKEGTLDQLSLQPVTEGILAIFSKRAIPAQKDKTTEKILAKYQDRFNQEEKGIKDYPVKHEEKVWKPHKEMIGLPLGSHKPWCLTSVDEFAILVPSKEASYWNEQLGQLKKIMATVDPEKKEKVLMWAGQGDPKRADWLVTMDNFLNQDNLSLEERLRIRSVFATALYDTILSTFHYKYTYWVERPFQFDPNLKTIVETPDHPSYPSAHSATSGAAKVILLYYFPEKKELIETTAEEAGQSRLWGGIHFPVDHEEGKKLGQAIGEKVLTCQKK